MHTTEQIARFEKITQKACLASQNGSEFYNRNLYVSYTNKKYTFLKGI